MKAKTDTGHGRQRNTMPTTQCLSVIGRRGDLGDKARLTARLIASECRVSCFPAASMAKHQLPTAHNDLVVPGHESKGKFPHKHALIIVPETSRQMEQISKD